MRDNITGHSAYYLGAFAESRADLQLTTEEPGAVAHDAQPHALSRWGIAGETYAIVYDPQLDVHGGYLGARGVQHVLGPLAQGSITDGRTRGWLRRSKGH